MRWIWVAVLMAGCSSAPDFAAQPLDRQSGVTAYRVDNRPGGGFIVTVRQDVGRFWPEPASMQADCRREAVALALAEARVRGIRVDVDERTARTAFGRNPFTSLSSCTGQVEAFPAR